ncbi:transmembrane protease serine 11D-like isoform X2 [Amblyomma americanum]
MARLLNGKLGQRDENPWMVFLAINFTEMSYCSATLLTEVHLLTAASCVYRNRTYPDWIKAYYLSTERLKGDFLYVDKVRIHTDYNSTTQRNDIAIITVQRPLVFTRYTKPICIPTNHMNVTDMRVTVAGWGRLNDSTPHQLTGRSGEDAIAKTEGSSPLPALAVGETSTSPSGGLSTRAQSDQQSSKVPDDPEQTSLYRGTMRGLHGEDCYSRFRYYGYDDLIMFCAAKDSTALCEGDTAAPAMVTGTDGLTYLLGLASYGYSCGSSDVPSVFVRIEAFVPWLFHKLNRFTEYTSIPTP